LKGIPLGEWRQLEAEEMNEIMMAIKDSSSTAKPKSNSGDSKIQHQEPRRKTMDRPMTSSKPTKTDRTSNPNPKSKELRGGYASQAARKTNPSRSASNTKGNRTSGKSGKR